MRNFKIIHALIAASSLALLAAAPARSSTSSDASGENAPVIKIENFIGTVEIITTPGDNITIKQADGANITRSGSNMSIDDDISVRSYNCKTRHDQTMIGKGKWRLYSNKGYRGIKEFPHVKISAPENVRLEIDKSIVFGDIKTIGSGDVDIGSCGDLKIGDVHGAFDLTISGNGNVKMGNSQDTTVSISGAGDLEAGDFSSANITLSGAGDLIAGDIIHHAKIRSSGAGDISVARIKGGLEYASSGASEFTADYVGGADLSVRASGSSDVTIKDGHVDALFIITSGASNVTYNGSSRDAETRASGASDIYIHTPSGDLHSSDSGAADVNIR